MIAQETKKRKAKFETRYLKVNAQLRENLFTNIEVPEIKLCGNWLAELGFLPDSKVSITARNKKLVIRVT